MTETSTLQINQAQVELDALRATLDADPGPLVLTISINRVTAKATIIQNPSPAGREIDDANTLIDMLQQVTEMQRVTLRKAMVEVEVARRIAEAAPSSATASSRDNGHHEPAV